MRIAHVVPHGVRPWSGVFTVVMGLTSALARRGHDVAVWQLEDWPADLYGPQVAVLDAAGVRRTRIPFRGGGRLTTVLRRPSDTPDADVVHLHAGFNASTAALARALDTPVAFSPHGNYSPESLGRSRARKAVWRLLVERPMLARVSLLCALSEREREDVRAFGYEGAVAVIPNGVAIPAEPADGAAFRAGLGIAPGQPLALYVGRVDVAHKGLDRLLHALAAAPAWQLALVGPDHRGGKAALSAMAEQLGIAQRVHFMGPRSGAALAEAYAGADVFTLLSRWEGLPVALLEALAYGIPAVVSPEVEALVAVADSGAGWVAAPEAGAVLRELASVTTADWRDKRGAARALASRYDWDDVAGQYEQAYLLARR